MADRGQVKLVYHAEKTVNSVSGLDQAFGMNFVYQPGNFSPLNDATNSALGQKSWAQWYQYCYVGGSKIQVKVTNNTLRNSVLANQEPIWFTVIPWGQVSLAADNTDHQPYRSTPYNKHKLLPLNCSTPQTINHYMSVKKFEGRSRPMDEELYSSYVSVSTNGYDFTAPNKLYWHLYLGNGEGLSGNIDVTYEVKITYYCTLYKRWQLTT